MSSLILDELNWGGLSSSSSLYNTATANGNDIDSILINETINNDGNDTDSIPFALPINDKINNKMHLFYGDCMKLPADAIVIGNYEVHHRQQHYHIITNSIIITNNRAYHTEVKTMALFLH